MAFQDIKSQFFYDAHDDTLHHLTTQPNEDLILEQNANLKKDNAYNDLSFGRQVASIPFIMYEKAIREGYDLNSPLKEVAEREMFRYLHSTEGKMCLVRNKV